MTKRELSKDEKELSEKQLDRHVENVIKLRGSLQYNKDVTKLNRTQRAFTTRWDSYKNKLKEEDEDNTNAKSHAC